MGMTELKRYIEEKIEEQEAQDLKTLHADPEHEIRTDRIGEYDPDEAAPDEEEEPQEDYKVKVKLVARAAREPVNQYVEAFLAEYCTVDPQSLRTAFKEVQSTEKYLKSMSKPLSTYFPTMLVLIAVIGGFLFLTNIDLIAGQFESLLARVS